MPKPWRLSPSTLRRYSKRLLPRPTRWNHPPSFLPQHRWLPHRRLVRQWPHPQQLKWQGHQPLKRSISVRSCRQAACNWWKPASKLKSFQSLNSCPQSANAAPRLHPSTNPCSRSKPAPAARHVLPPEWRFIARWSRRQPVTRIFRKAADVRGMELSDKLLATWMAPAGATHLINIQGGIRWANLAWV